MTHEAARREVARVQAGDVMEKFTAAYLRGADAVVSNSLCATRVHMRSDRMLLCSRWYQSVRRSRVGRFSVSARRRPGDRIKSYAAKPDAQVLYRRVGAGGSLVFLAPALLDLLTVGLSIFAAALLELLTVGLFVCLIVFVRARARNVLSFTEPTRASSCQLRPG